MTILFGHPTGNPNSMQAALAHYEANQLEAFCIPWMPTAANLNLLKRVPGLHSMTDRLSRRRFEPLSRAPLLQDQIGEWRRLAIRAVGIGDERLSYEANDWLMDTMARKCRRPTVTAVHSYEDCSLKQFEEAKRRGKACIYDMPIGFYPAWQTTQKRLIERYAQWLPLGLAPQLQYVRPEQKAKEMALADLVLVPSSFVDSTIRTFFPDKRIALAPYSADLEFWSVQSDTRQTGPLKFIYAGQMSLRKGIPLLLDAWVKAGLKDAQLDLVGMWALNRDRLSTLPEGVHYHSPCSPAALRDYFHKADVFVFPSNFEGFGLVLSEALACGLPAIASTATAGPDILNSECGTLIPPEDLDALVSALRWYHDGRNELPRMRSAARKAAVRWTWDDYRNCVRVAVAGFC